MGLSDIVTVTLSTVAAAVTRPGFGEALVLSPEATFTPDLVREYSSLTGLAVDFATTTATYKMVSAMFSQSPRPPKVKVGRSPSKPTQSFTVTPVVTDSTTYTLTIDGTSYSFTSGVGTTATLICNGLRTAIGSPAGLTIGGTTTLTIVATVAGAFHAVAMADISKLGVKQDHADPGTAADLTAIALVDNNWYAILYPFNSYACAEAVADYAEANQKLFCNQTQESNVLTVAAGSDSTSIAVELEENLRAPVVYHPATDAFIDAALMGAVLPLTPGTWTAAFKTLATVSTYPLTETQRTNALAKNATVYELVAGIGITEFGNTGTGSFMDIVQFRDFLQSTISTDIFAALASSAKIPYTDPGISVITGIIKGDLKKFIGGGIAATPAPTVSAPAAASVSSADKSSRVLNNVTFAATLAGAIHTVNITGTLSV